MLYNFLIIKHISNFKKYLMIVNFYIDLRTNFPSVFLVSTSCSERTSA